MHAAWSVLVSERVGGRDGKFAFCRLISWCVADSYSGLYTYFAVEAHGGFGWKLGSKYMMACWF